MVLRLLAQEDFNKLLKGMRGFPTWRAEKTGELWPKPDDPDNWQDEAEDRETLDNERDDHEGVPVVDLTPDDG